MTAYRFEVYDFAHYPVENHARMDEMVEAGWRIHTCVPHFTECSVMWERSASPGARDKGPAPGLAGGPQDDPEEHETASGRKSPGGKRGKDS